MHRTLTALLLTLTACSDNLAVDPGAIAVFLDDPRRLTVA